VCSYDKGYVAAFPHQTGRVFGDVMTAREKLSQNMHMDQDDAEMLSQETG
jgi:hypothetical protein